MKALNLHGVNKLVYDDVAMPIRQQDEVLIKVRAVGICGSDIPRVFEKGTYHFPTIIGHEFSGEIVEAGDSRLVGRGAAVFPLLPCGECSACKTGNYAQCSNYSYYGSRCDGGMSEYIAVKQQNLVMIPEGVSYEEAAMCEPTAVALHALRKADMKVCDKVVIYGVGPIALLMAQWARLAGAGKVVLVVRSKAKAEFAKELGFTDIVDSSKGDVLEEVRKVMVGCEPDICVEGTGTSEGLENCLLMAKNFGKIVMLGNPLGDMSLSQKAYWCILRKELKLIGTWNSSFNAAVNDWQDCLAAMQTGQLKVRPLITHQFALEDYKKAFAIMHEKQEMYCKIMFVDKSEEVKIK